MPKDKQTLYIWYLIVGSFLGFIPIALFLIFTKSVPIMLFAVISFIVLIFSSIYRKKSKKLTLLLDGFLIIFTIFYLWSRINQSGKIVSESLIQIFTIILVSLVLILPARSMIVVGHKLFKKYRKYLPYLDIIAEVLYAILLIAIFIA
ncbi:MAG: hypothetical protein ACE5J4_02555 [Candidatus Aenigmatarchaeota archaeon]